MQETCRVWAIRSFPLVGEKTSSRRDCESAQANPPHVRRGPENELPLPQTLVLAPPQLGRELVREIHGPLAVLLCRIGSLLQQGNDAMTGIIRRIRVPLSGECNNRI
jgi:hypothetical protein